MGNVQALVQVTVPSVVVAPGDADHVGVAPPVVPAVVTISTLPLASVIRACNTTAWFATQPPSGTAVMLPWSSQVTPPSTIVAAVVLVQAGVVPPELPEVIATSIRAWSFRISWPVT